MHSAQTNADRAVATYTAMQRSLYAGDGSSLYRESIPWSGNPYAYVWSFSRALLGTLNLAGISGGQAYAADVADRLRGLERYWHRDAYASYVRGGGDTYYDDNAWIALALVQAYRMRLSTSLDRPRQLFRFACDGWDREPNDPLPGGLFWVQQGVGYGLSNHDRGAGASVGSAELGLHLHELTGSAEFDGDGLVMARPRSVGALNMLEWVARHLDSTASGHGPFWNVARRDGSVDTNVWSYNQGVMLGARVLRFRLTGQPAELRLAEGIARQALETFGDFTGHPPAFNAMCFQNMLMLHAATADTALQSELLATMRRYADWVWDPTTGARDSRTNLFSFNEGGEPARGSEPAKVQDQGAMLQLFALLAWDPSDYVKLT